MLVRPAWTPPTLKMTVAPAGMHSTWNVWASSTCCPFSVKTWAGLWQSPRRYNPPYSHRNVPLAGRAARAWLVCSMRARSWAKSNGRSANSRTCWLGPSPARTGWPRPAALPATTMSPEYTRPFGNVRSPPTTREGPDAPGERRFPIE